MSNGLPREPLLRKIAARPRRFGRYLALIVPAGHLASSVHWCGWGDGGAQMRKSISIAIASVLVLGGCSTVMEANRPAPVNLSKYSLGEKRMDVISTLGAPKNSVKDGDNSCDVYELYTTGNNKGQKAAVILGEAGADLFTAGLFELVATPAEAVTKSKQHTVLLCYASDSSLISVKDEGKTIVTRQTATPSSGDPRTP